MQNPFQEVIEWFNRSLRDQLKPNAQSYLESLERENLNSLDLIASLTLDDLPSIGITSLGHKKLFMREIEELKTPKNLIADPIPITDPIPIPDPTILCKQCNILEACYHCSDCPKNYCVKCYLDTHKDHPSDVSSHVPQILNQGLQWLEKYFTVSDRMIAQSKDVEESELKLEMDCLSTCKHSLSELKSVLAQLGNSQRVQALQKEIENMDKRCTLPETTVVVMGDTGAGKSSTLNALLGEESILPTNSMVITLYFVILNFCIESVYCSDH